MVGTGRGVVAQTLAGAALVAASALGALGVAGCRMGPALEGPQLYPSEFGAPMAKLGRLTESDIEPRSRVEASLKWPATLAVLQVHRDTRYAGLSQQDWDDGVKVPQTGVRLVNVLDGLGVGDEELHSQPTRRDNHAETRPGLVDAETQALFVRERWAASAAGSNLVFVFATKVASDTYWNYWWTSYFLLVPTPFVPAQEQTVQAVSKGFLVDVKTGKILETAGQLSTRSRRANPILRTEPIFQIERDAVREAELKMIQQLAGKLGAMRRTA